MSRNLSTIVEGLTGALDCTCPAPNGCPKHAPEQFVAHHPEVAFELVRSLGQILCEDGIILLNHRAATLLENQIRLVLDQMRVPATVRLVDFETVKSATERNSKARARFVVVVGSVTAGVVKQEVVVQQVISDYAREAVETQARKFDASLDTRPLLPEGPVFPVLEGSDLDVLLKQSSAIPNYWQKNLDDLQILIALVGGDPHDLLACGVPEGMIAGRIDPKRRIAKVVRIKPTPKVSPPPYTGQPIAPPDGPCPICGCPSDQPCLHTAPKADLEPKCRHEEAELIDFVHDEYARYKCQKCGIEFEVTG
jgi:hypothetical protein